MNAGNVQYRECVSENNQASSDSVDYKQVVYVVIPRILDPKPAFNSVGSPFAYVAEPKQVELLAHFLPLPVQLIEHILL